MSKIKLYIDEDASREAFVNALRRVNIDCLTTLEANNLGYSDSEQLKGIEKLIDTFSAEQIKNQLVFLGLYIRS